jgi:hypothetical protein
MLQFAERLAVDRGYRYIRLYTNEAMTENIALYSLGMKILRRGGWGAPTS